MIRGKSWNDGWLTAFWGREPRGCSKDLVFGSPSRPDGHFLYGVFSFLEVHAGKTFTQELESRGYDITTLQFSIRKKAQPATQEPGESA